MLKLAFFYYGMQYWNQFYLTQLLLKIIFTSNFFLRFFKNRGWVLLLQQELLQMVQKIINP